MKKITSLRFTTGEFAELCGLNRRTLHYYDEIGIFHPSYVGDNGYRYYTIDQLDRLNLIVTLRDLGVSLEDIRKCLDGHDEEELNRLLEQQDREIDRTIRQLQQKQKLLRTTLDSNRAFQKHLNRGYQIQELPEERWEVIWDIDRDLAQSRGRQSGEITSVAGYLTDGPYTGMYLCRGRHLLFQKREDGSRIMPAGRYLCCYRSVPEAVQQLEKVEEEEKALRQHAEEEHLPLSDCAYVEYNDILAGGEDRGREEFVYIRAQIVEPAGEEVPPDRILFL